MKPFTFGESVALRVADADQQHTLQRMATMFGPAVSVAPTAHPWYRSLGETVVRRIIDRTAVLCPHIGPGRGFGPMYAVLSSGVMPILCRACMTTRRRRLGPVDDLTCDRCSVYTRRGLFSSALPVGPLLIIFGVCRSCAVELGAVRDDTTAA